MSTKTVRLHDKLFEVSIPAETIDRAIADIADRINRDDSLQNPIFLCVLNGAFMFASDLLKQITLPNTVVSFVKISSYVGTSSSGSFRDLIGITEKVENRNVVIVEDMIDSGASILHLKRMLMDNHARLVKVAAMFHKPNALVYPLDIDFPGMALENDFVVGRGLDYDGLGRNLPDLYTLVKE